MTLAEAFAALRAGLTPLGIEIGPDVLALWLDRDVHGREPLPADALRVLEELAGRLAKERE